VPIYHALKKFLTPEMSTMKISASFPPWDGRLCFHYSNSGFRVSISQRRSKTYLQGASHSVTESRRPVCWIQGGWLYLTGLVPWWGWKPKWVKWHQHRTIWPTHRLIFSAPSMRQLKPYCKMKPTHAYYANELCVTSRMAEN